METLNNTKMLPQSNFKNLWWHPAQKETFLCKCAACASLQYTSSHSPYCCDKLCLWANNTAGSSATADDKSQPVQSFKSIHCSVLNGVLPLSTIAHTMYIILLTHLLSAAPAEQPQWLSTWLSVTHCPALHHATTLHVSSRFTFITYLTLVNWAVPLEVDCHLIWSLCSFCIRQVLLAGTLWLAPAAGGHKTATLLLPPQCTCWAYVNWLEHCTTEHQNKYWH